MTDAAPTFETITVIDPQPEYWVTVDVRDLGPGVYVVNNLGPYAGPFETIGDAMGFIERYCS